MKKKWMGGLLALALAALCMLPTQVQAASTSTTEKHMHGDVECILWTDEREPVSSAAPTVQPATHCPMWTMASSAYTA